MPLVGMFSHHADGSFGILGSQLDDGVNAGIMHRIGIGLRERLKMRHVHHRQHLHALWHWLLVQVVTQSDSGNAVFIQERGHLHHVALP